MSSLKQHDLRLMAHTESHRPGGDPSTLLDLLASALVDRKWQTFNDDNGKKFANEFDFLTRRYPEGIGLDVETLKQLQLFRHRNEAKDSPTKERMAELRVCLKAALGDEQAREESGLIVGEHGTNQHTRTLYQENIMSSEQQGTSRAYRIGTLQKEAPDIAERVIAKEISAAAGIRELRRRNGEDVPEPGSARIAIRKTDAHSAYHSLINNLPDGVLHELINLLNEWREANE